MQFYGTIVFRLICKAHLLDAASLRKVTNYRLFFAYSTQTCTIDPSLLNLYLLTQTLALLPINITTH